MTGARRGNVSGNAFAPRLQPGLDVALQALHLSRAKIRPCVLVRPRTVTVPPKLSMELTTSRAGEPGNFLNFFIRPGHVRRPVNPAGGRAARSRVPPHRVRWW